MNKHSPFPLLFYHTPFSFSSHAHKMSEIDAKIARFFENNNYITPPRTPCLRPKEDPTTDDMPPLVLPPQRQQQRYHFCFDTSAVETEINQPREHKPVMQVTFDIGRNHHTQHILEFTDEFRSIRQAIDRVEAYFNQPLPFDDLAALKAANDVHLYHLDFYPYRGSALGTLRDLRNKIIWLEFTEPWHLRIHCE